MGLVEQLAGVFAQRDQRLAHVTDLPGRRLGLFRPGLEVIAGFLRPSLGNMLITAPMTTQELFTVDRVTTVMQAEELKWQEAMEPTGLHPQRGNKEDPIKTSLHEPTWQEPYAL